MTLAEQLKERLREGFAKCGFESDVLERVSISASADLRFEEAARLRDLIRGLEGGNPGEGEGGP